MIIEFKNRKIKRIPGKYQIIKNITDYLEDFDHIRLTKKEREYLQNSLFSQSFEQLVQKLKQDDSELYEKVKNSFPIYAVKVKVNGQSATYVIRTDNNISLKCSKQIYEQCPNKRKNATQLTLFES